MVLYTLILRTNLEQFLESIVYILYIFRSLGSQESNTSNGVQIEAKMKKLWPLEDNHTKLKDNFASCEITNSTCEIHLCNPRYLRPNLLDFFFRYFMFKSIFSPCNPPIIGFLS